MDSPTTIEKPNFNEAQISPEETDNIQQWEEEAKGPILTRWELWGWYIYGIATEPFNTCIFALFMPNSLALAAAQQGFELDHQTPCDYDKPNYSCEMKWGGGWVDTTSYALYIQTIACLIQAVLFIFLGALADHGNNRKRFMFSFGYLGSIACILMVACRTYKLIWLSSILFSLGSIGYGCSYVFFYSYIPIYSRAHPRLIRSMLSQKSGIDTIHIPQEIRNTKLLKDKQIAKDIDSSPDYIQESISNRLSAFCTIISNGAAVLVLVICLVIVALVTFDGLYVMYICTCLVGVWWFALSTWSMFNIKQRPGAPLPAGTNIALLSVKRTWSTVRKVKAHPEMFKFLFAWFALSDGSTTITSIASLFCQNVFNMSEINLGIVVVIAPLTTLIGAFAFLWIQNHFKISAYRMLLVDCLLFVVLCVYIFIGYFTTAFGLRHSAEIYPIVAYYGVVYGGLISLTRALFVDFCPPGREAEFFSIFELADKGQAWLGPLVSAGITARTHDIRYAFAWCIALIIIGTIVLFFVDHKKGKKDVQKFMEVNASNQDSFAMCCENDGEKSTIDAKN